MSEREDRLNAFYGRIQHAANTEFGVDSEGDPRVEVILVDRTRTQKLHFWPVPYPHHAQTDEEWQEILDAAHLNLALAAQDLDVTYQIWRDRQRRLAAANTANNPR